MAKSTNQVSPNRVLASVVLSLSFLFTQIFAQSFKEQQLKNPRVLAASVHKEAVLRDLFKQKGVSYPPKQIFIRVFKTEQSLELWALPANSKDFTLVKQYQICASSGVPGPKRKQGDGQVPEGFYSISIFNPTSNFHLSLKVDYPNRADLINGGKGNPGGDIFIHGNCVTIGCMPMTDDKIEELYLVAVEAKSAGQRDIPVHIFPTRLDKTGMQRLVKLSGGNDDLMSFWANLKEGYDYFEQHHQIPAITVDKYGKYQIKR